MKSTFTVPNTIYQKHWEKNQSTNKKRRVIIMKNPDTLIYFLSLQNHYFWKEWLFALAMSFRTMSKFAIVLAPFLHSSKFVIWSQSKAIYHFLLFNDFFRSLFRGFLRWFLNFCGWVVWNLIIIIIFFPMKKSWFSSNFQNLTIFY